MTWTLQRGADHIRQSPASLRIPWHGIVARADLEGTLHPALPEGQECFQHTEQGGISTIQIPSRNPGVRWGGGHSPSDAPQLGRAGQEETKHLTSSLEMDQWGGEGETRLLLTNGVEGETRPWAARRRINESVESSGPHSLSPHQNRSHLSKHSTAPDRTAPHHSTVSMDVSIQYPWFRRPYFPGYFPGRIYEQFFGEHIPDGDLFSPLFSMFYNRPSYMRGWMDGGFSEVGAHADGRHW